MAITILQRGLKPVCACAHSLSICAKLMFLFHHASLLQVGVSSKILYRLQNYSMDVNAVLRISNSKQKLEKCTVTIYKFDNLKKQ